MLYKNIAILLFILTLCLPIIANAALDDEERAKAIAQLRSDIRNGTDSAKEGEGNTPLSLEKVRSMVKLVAPVIDKANAETILVWAESEPSVKITECAVRYKTCVDAALKGGHTNFIAEASRIHFCKTSKVICGEYWK